MKFPNQSNNFEKIREKFNQ